MPDLVWDETLYEEAKAHAQKCIFAHDPEDKVYGENLALSYGRIADPVESWYLGRKRTGHYSQVVCATTRQVGCIMITCPTILIPEQNETLSNVFYSVCRYMPPIFVGQEPYEKV
ncbi:cysteine-rich secretory protein LCCL domain-containing 2 [Clonorchis sinensis]|uniref:Cysteine-rich secretory protein LCCL domain-containing 2 n=1 Tax=Clonorchis sinensis TaxID=79923 RepID=G7YVZ9_CLOSI|nr:cysteine-rich secretory protein LCCL domain-containing 2 [Clonorchis sinensis]